MELDLWLERFTRRELATLSTSERMQYERLLEYSDLELLDMLQGRIEPPLELGTLILRIQQN
jgi:succinate dehydrogenase flavin-adding protein (antitoxin of CptAB toxin-antitoxin module)